MDERRKAQETRKKTNKLVLFCQIADHESQMISLGTEHSPPWPKCLTYGVSRLTILC